MSDTTTHPIKAQRLEDIKRTLKPQPLAVSELDQYFVETSDVRMEQLTPRGRIADNLEADRAKILLFGHRGSGKSTELAKLQQELSGTFSFLTLSVQRDAKNRPGGTVDTIEGILILIASRIAQELHSRLDITLNPDILKKINEWFISNQVISEKQLEIESTTGVSAEVPEALSRFVGITASLETSTRGGIRVVEQAVNNQPRLLNELAYYVGALVEEASKKIEAVTKRPLVLAIEDMDKYDAAPARRIFVENTGALLSLPCRAIFSAQVWLLFGSVATATDQFIKVRLPMIKVRERNGEPHEQGIRTLMDIVYRRIDRNSNLISEEALRLAIVKTGGILRHLFEVIVNAAFAARQRAQRAPQAGSNKITEEDVRIALNEKRTTLRQGIGVYGLASLFQDEPDFQNLRYEDLEARIKHFIHDEKSQDATSDPVTLVLVLAQAVIEYNGDGWQALHPLIEEAFS